MYLIANLIHGERELGSKTSKPVVKYLRKKQRKKEWKNEWTRVESILRVIHPGVARLQLHAENQETYKET